MLQLSRWKIGLVVLAALFGLLFTLPNVVPAGSLPSWMPHQRLNLGLDLQGGSYLLLEVDTAALKAEQLGNLAEDARTSLQTLQIKPQITLANGVVDVAVQPDQASAAMTELRKLNRPLQSGTSRLDVRTGEPGHIVMSIPDRALTEESSDAVKKSIEIVRRRIDKLGTREPSIVQQGATRIVVEAPGESDPERLQRVIGQTAKLTFQLVDPNTSAADVIGGRAPEDVMMPNSEGGPDLVLRRKVIVSGEMLQSAQGEFDSQGGKPVVSFRFNGQGAKNFGEVTRTNIGRQFAIVLDNKVVSAPVIRSAIEGGSGIIEGGADFTLKRVTELGLVLSSGALPAPLKVIEQRTVGAQLGADAVRAGQVSTLVGAVAIFVFVILAYGLFGWFAAAALVVNGLLIVAFMSVTQATLTLPGIAGLILTLAVAVDANVLIYERARDEARAGRAPMAAMDLGYKHAMATIIDANLTSFIAAAIMATMGSGPVKGFAITLMVGIVSSVLTAILVTQVLIGWWLRSAKPKQLPISEVVR